MNDFIKLHPKNYKEVSDKIIFYINEQKVSQNNFESIFKELRASKTLVVTSYKKNASSERRYSVYVGHYVLNFFGSDYLNLQCTSVLYGKKAVEKKDNLYRTKIFTIIPSGGVFVVYNKEIHPSVSDNSWKMEQSVLNNLLDSMEAYFEADDANEDGSDAKKEKIKISERFRRNIIRPFRDYTDKENWVEQYKQAQGDGIGYFRREFIRKNDKGPVYGFYSTDINANPENGSFSIGDRVTVIDTNGTEHGVYTGVIEDIDDESDDAVILSIAIYHQADDIDLPLTGRLVMAVNDTQTRVRSKVIRSMERCKLESKYMYHVFDDFSVDGYEEIQDDLKDYLVEKMASQYPPNQMQLEAIIKGILTEDLLLVLGPPGTGKTTVISFWVEYFIKKGLRVLISSQNNAAVDNVLARFGTIAETVRLGNENKVQDNCKAYLPQNKIASMQDYYNQNYDRVQEELEYNKEEIRLYKGRLEIYKKLYETYFERKKVLDEYIAMNRENMRRIAELYENVEKVEKELDSLLEYRARKEIFLQVYETKSFLVRLLRKRYFNRAKAELEEGEPYLKTLREKYVQSIDAYNSMTKVAEQQNLEYRDKNVESAYNESLRLLKEYSQKTSTDEFLPKFRGEISKLYDTPCFEIEPSNNWTIIMSEAEALASLEKIISKMSRALGEWNDIVNNERNDIMQNALLETCKIVGATCIGINSNKDFANVKFDVAIIDEAGQIQIHNALIPMSRARKNLLLGDYKQIPPCANDDVVAACEADEIDTKLLNMSFFEYIFEAMRKKTIDRLESQSLDRSLILKPVLEDYEAEPYKKFEPETVQDMIKRVTEDPKKLVNLNSQFRMPGNISDIISEWFYEGNYHSSYNMDKFSAIVPGTDKPLVVISTSKAKKRKESQPASKMGYQNLYEAELIANMVADIVESQQEKAKGEYLEKIEDNIGIISAYGAQVRLIRERLSKKKLGIKESQIRSMVASLDSFQGQERPLILYSLTRSTTYKKPEMGRVGFMKELRRLNVAFTRCQKQLVIVGDIDYLTQCMNMEALKDEGTEWPCAHQEETEIIDNDTINQCAECPAICERKFARFMRLLMQHVDAGAGNSFQSEDFFRRKA